MIQLEYATNLARMWPECRWPPWSYYNTRPNIINFSDLIDCQNWVVQRKTILLSVFAIKPKNMQRTGGVRNLLAR